MAKTPKQIAQAPEQGLSANEVAGLATDPDFYSTLAILPNPDEVLRKSGESQRVYDAIAADAHVMAERRAMKSSLSNLEFSVIPGGEQAQDLAAAELCRSILKRKPSLNNQWNDLLWNMMQCVLRGMTVHEVIWEYRDGALLPREIKDRPNRRFVFSTAGELRLRTKAQSSEGVPVEPYVFLLSRHMPSERNPYGEAVYSSCFWPYVFKHGGFKFFSKFCERFGFPWPIGKYPDGTDKKQQTEFARNLAQMVEAGVAVIPQSSSVELLESKSSGQVVHQSLINACNAEISKAITSQTLATEIQGNGSRAASETHRDRERDVVAADRTIVEATMTELFQWITTLNFPNAQPPRFELYDTNSARKEEAELLDVARGYLKIPLAYAYERLQIPQPKPGEDVLPEKQSFTPVPGQSQGSTEFSEPSAPTQQDVTAIAELDQAIEQGWIAPIDQMLNAYIAENRTLQEFMDALPEVFGAMDDDEVRILMEASLKRAIAKGVSDA